MSAKINLLLVLLSCVLFTKAVIANDFDLTSEEELGKFIFFDEDLSINQNQSCASCHGPDVGWTGPQSFINEGGSVYEGSILGRFGNRKPPSFAYANRTSNTVSVSFTAKSVN